MRGGRSIRAVGSEGFTLIELLVVIAIIAILAAILFPIMTAAKEAGRKGTCMSNEKQIAAGLIMFAQDHGDRPPCAFFNDHPSVFGSGVPSQWKACVRPYIRTPRVFLCPSDEYKKYKQVWEKGDFNKAENYDLSSSYRINNTLVKRSTDPATLDWPMVPYTLGSVNTSKLILVCESQPYPQTATTTPDKWPEYNQVAAYNSKTELPQAQIYSTTPNPQSCPVPFERHSSGANYGFADGHVRWMKWKQTWQPSDSNNGPNYWNGWTKPPC